MITGWCFTSTIIIFCNSYKTEFNT